MGHFSKRTTRIMGSFLITLLTALTALMAGSPAHAGDEITITLNNKLPKTQPLYPRLALRAGDYDCWYPRDLADDGIAAPAGGGFANYTSEVVNRFFSFCNPTWNPLGAAMVRWQQFRLVAQTQPGGAWQTITWDDKDFSTFLMSYWKLVNDVRGFHFDLSGAAPGTVLKTPVGKACLQVEPRMFNFTGLFTMTVTKSETGTCNAPATAARPAKQDRTISLRVDRERQVVVGALPGDGNGLRWKVRSGQCTSRHFAAEKMQIERGPGESRWQVVTVRGTSAGRDTCMVDLVASGGQRVMSQQLKVSVR